MATTKVGVRAAHERKRRTKALRLKVIRVRGVVSRTFFLVYWRKPPAAVFAESAPVPQLTPGKKRGFCRVGQPRRRADGTVGQPGLA
jgi:hypothetical protein